MKLKFLSLIGLVTVSVCACGSDKEQVSNIVTVPEPDYSIETEEISMEQSTEQEETKIVKKKTLADIRITEPLTHPVVEISEEESSEEELSEEFSTSVPEESEEVKKSEVKENPSNWDSLVYDNLGVHAPFLDDWYKYKRSDIVLNGKIYEFTEVSEENPSKTITVEICNGQLYISAYFKEWQKDSEVLGKRCEESYNDAANEGEFIYSKDDIYYKLIFANTSREEFDEITKFIVSNV